MKIAIATFNNALSYGAMIQAYALKCALEEMNHEVEVLDHACPGNELIDNADVFYQNIKQIREPLVKNAIRRFLFVLFQKRKLDGKIRKFSQFKETYLLGSSRADGSDPEKYDLLVCGSDQIWNPEITNGYNDLFFGITAEKIPAVAYAASIGDVNLIQKYGKDDFLKRLQSFQAISCRELDLKELLSVNEIPAELVFDPSLIVDKHVYEGLVCSKPIVAQDYLLVFHLGKNALLKKTAQKIAKQMRLKVVFLQGSGIPISLSKSNMGNASPGEFLNLIKYSKYVVTDSFHGLALSLAFEKDFNVVLPMKRAMRVKNLLAQIELEDRIVSDKVDVEISCVNYPKVNELLKLRKQYSLDFLRKITEKKYERL